MTPDIKTIETLVEIITREVLMAMVEQEEKKKKQDTRIALADGQTFMFRRFV